MIQVPKFQFKSKTKIKSPTSKKNRMIKLGIDTTTGILIVAMFFFARHLRLMMPGPPPQPIKFSALADALNSKAATATSSVSGMLAQKTASTAPPSSTSVTSSTPATVSSISEGAAQPVAATPGTSGASATTPPGSLAMQVEVPGSSNTAEQNLGGWITPTSKPDRNQAAATPADQDSTKANDGSLGRAMMAAMSPPARTEPSQPQIQPDSAKPAPVSLGDSLMAVLSPSAKAETIQSEMQPGKTTQSMAAPAARQALRVQPPVHHEPVPLTDEQKRLVAAQARFSNVMEMAVSNPDVFGFSPGEHLDDTTLGTPIPVYTITQSDRKNYQLGQPVKQLLQTTNEWMFPAMLNNRVRFMVPVKLEDGEYVADTSSRALAMVYEKIRQRWPASQGYHPELVTYPNIVDYYFTIPELPDQNLTDTSVMFQFNPTLSPASVILASWQ